MFLPKLDCILQIRNFFFFLIAYFALVIYLFLCVDLCLGPFISFFFSFRPHETNYLHTLKCYLFHPTPFPPLITKGCTKAFYNVTTPEHNQLRKKGIQSNKEILYFVRTAAGSHTHYVFWKCVAMPPVFCSIYTCE